ncbi:MAG: hypothetical protein WAP93_07970, partial [Tepidanaerobacteraceae bacterium]
MRLLKEEEMMPLAFGNKRSKYRVVKLPDSVIYCRCSIPHILSGLPISAVYRSSHVHYLI